MSDIRQEALLNEYKGNIFEYLTGLSLARSYDKELDFLNSITADFQQMLTQQEQFIREYYPHLLIDLPALAQGLSHQISKQLPNQNISKVQLVGKAASATQQNRFKEGDLLLFSAEQIFPVSLKLCKANSFVNTKSGGLKSFISKYFDNEKLQKQLDTRLEVIMHEMVYALYALVDIEADATFSNWIKAELPTLPGQLEGELRECYLNFLYQVNRELYQVIRELYEVDKEHFVRCLMPLIGFGSSDIIQATTFYQNKDEHYQLAEHLVENFSVIDRAKIDVSLGEYDQKKTSFEIFFQDRILQLRIKAMNKFTSRSFKINCSVKKRN